MFLYCKLLWTEVLPDPITIYNSLFNMCFTSCSLWAQTQGWARGWLAYIKVQLGVHVDFVLKVVSTLTYNRFVIQNQKAEDDPYLCCTAVCTWTITFSSFCICLSLHLWKDLEYFLFYFFVYLIERGAPVCFKVDIVVRRHHGTKIMKSFQKWAW